MNNDDDMTAEEFVSELKKSNVNWRQGKMGPNSKMNKDYAVDAFPTKVVIGKNGNVLYIDNFIDKDTLKALIEADK
ncbi:MAG: hypothetical protein JNM28_01095 [Armatimonadetes bacterium]|nr:hypothetical protein [Armatimonadota bacterium]MBS1711095.1 hypothetical protein [Armatimonadota bacterium]MBX3108768.1 hypothetical protein [Fimbriimonadaceae bacterium]